MKILILIAAVIALYFVYYYIIPLAWVTLYVIVGAFKGDSYRIHPIANDKGRRTGMTIVYRNHKKYGEKFVFLNFIDEYYIPKKIKTREAVWTITTYYMSAFKRIRCLMEESNE